MSLGGRRSTRPDNAAAGDAPRPDDVRNSPLRLETYERVAPDAAQGFNAAGELRPGGRLTVTVGVAHVDRNYLAPAA